MATISFFKIPSLHQKASFLPFGVPSGCGDKLQTYQRIESQSFSNETHGATGARKGVGDVTSRPPCYHFLTGGSELSPAVGSRSCLPAFTPGLVFLISGYVHGLYWPVLALPLSD